MKKVLISFLLILCYYQSFSQTGWHWRNPKPHGFPVTQVIPLSVTGHLLTITSAGTLYKSVNNGSSWNKITLPYPSQPFPQLTGINFPNPLIGYISGYNNSIYKTVDGGNTWSLITTPTPTGNHWNSVYFLSNDTGFVIGVGGALARTSDGGTTWQNIPSSVTTDLKIIFFKNSQVGYCHGGNKLIKTQDGGITWTTIRTFLGSSHSVSPSKSDTLFATYDNSGSHIYSRSVNGGLNWSNINFSSQTAIGPIYFQNRNVGYELRNGLFYKTVNGGSNWSLVNTLPSSVYNFNTYNNQDFYFWGSAGTIYISPDAGLTITPCFSNDTEHPFYAVYYSMLNKKGQGMALSTNRVHRTSDGGRTWKTDTTSWNCFSIADHDFVTQDTVFASTSCGLIVSYDATVTWQNLLSDNLRAVDFLNSDTGLVVSATTNNIYKTIDGGATWQTVYSTTSFAVNDILWLGTDTAIFGTSGTNGRVFKTTNGGQSWSQVYSTTSSFGKFYNSKDTIYSIQTNGQILKSINAGQTWNAISLSSSFITPYQLIVYSGQHLLATCLNFLINRSLILSSSDGGTTWTSFPYFFIGAHNSIASKDTASLLVTGVNSFIGQYLSVSDSLLSSFTPSDYLVCNGDSIHFINQSNPALSFQWYVNGNPVSTSYNFSALLSPGIYHVGLRANSSLYSDYSESTIRVVGTPSNINYTNSNTTVNFQNNATTAQSWYWDFGDSTFSTLSNPSHTYNSTGNYPITLISTSGNCGSDTSQFYVTIPNNTLYSRFDTDYSLNGVTQFVKAKSTYDGGIICVAAGGGLTEFKTDGQGRRHWYSKNSHSTGAIVLADIASSRDRFTISVGKTTNGIGVVYRVDSAGNQVWSSQFTNFQPFSVCVKDNFIYCAGYTFTTSANAGLLAIDTSGNVLWFKTFSLNPQSFLESTPIVALPDKSCILSIDGGVQGNDMWLLRIDTLGNEMWRRNYYTSTFYSKITHIRSDDSGYVFISGIETPLFVTTLDTTRNFISKIDPFTNTTQWAKRYTFSSNYISNAPKGNLVIDIAKNGNLIAMLNTTPIVSNYLYKHYTLTLTPSGDPINTFLDYGTVNDIAAMPDTGFVWTGYHGPSFNSGGAIKRIGNSGMPACLYEPASCQMDSINLPFNTIAATSTFVQINSTPPGVIHRRYFTVPTFTTCSCSTPLTIQVSPDTGICIGDTIALHVSGAGTYQWLQPSIYTSANADTILVSPPTSTIYSLLIDPYTGCGEIRNISVDVDSVPTPVITNNSNVLFSNYTYGNQWYYNGNPIAGATSPQLTISQSGLYMLEVTSVNGCVGYSTVFTTTSSQYEDTFLSGLSITPNPCDGNFLIQLNNLEKITLINIHNMLGELVYVSIEPDNNEIKLSDIVEGTYILTCTTVNKSVYHEKLIITKN
jgi:photosystem II stability/assembly factor-like uncharacterized protein